MSRFNFALMSCGLMALGLIGCASRTEFSQPPSAISPQRVAQFEKGKVFEAGDCFELDIRGYRYDFTVSADGTLALPLAAEPVRIAGLTPSEVVKLICETYQPDGPQQREVNVLPCFEPISDYEQATAWARAEEAVKRAARKRGWKGNLNTAVRMSAPYQRRPETGDEWMISIWEDGMGDRGSRGRSAIAVISVSGKVISFTETGGR